MSAIRTAKHGTKKRIVVNLKTGRTVNVAKRWAVSYHYKGNYWSKYYFKKSAEEALKHYANWTTKLFIEEIDYSHILDDEGDVYNDWVDVEDPQKPHKTMKEWNELLANLKPMPSNNPLLAAPAVKLRLTYEDYKRAAVLLSCDVPSIRAVTEVESGGSGFTKEGKCIIRFEPHKFHEKTKGIYDSSNPAISFPKRKDGYPVGVSHSWELFTEAAKLNPTAAVWSTSWGMFQVLGQNYVSCGCQNLGEFVKRMETSEGEQLAMFCSLIKDWGLDDELRNHQWAILARVYNGPTYRQLNYDVRLAKAYERFRMAV